MGKAWEIRVPTFLDFRIPRYFLYFPRFFKKKKKSKKNPRFNILQEYIEYFMIRHLVLNYYSLLPTGRIHKCRTLFQSHSQHSTAFYLQYKLCKIKRVSVGPKGVPYVTTHDARTIRYPDPLIKCNDTVQVDIATGKIKDFIKFDSVM